MILFAITADTWLVTGMGFGLVLVLLFVFVYLMKGLGYIMHRSSSTAGAHQSPLASNNAQQQVAAGDEIAIAVALNLYYNALHDVEPAHLTLKSHHTMWNNNL